jgi:hypothetical protein
MIIAFFTLHVILYVNFLVRMGMFWTSARHAKIVVGLASAAIFLLIGITSTQWVRRRWYAVFYRVHIAGSVGVLVLLYFHVEAVRGYLVGCAVIVAMNAVLRFRFSR